MRGPERAPDFTVSPDADGLNRSAPSGEAVPDERAAAKDAAARRAVERVRPGMRVALGTGSTAGFAVRAIAERFPGSALDCVASSRGTEELARSLGLPVRALREDDEFDLMIDGADEVTPTLDLTKGGGGALLREKLLAGLSHELLVVVDPPKLVRHLGEKSPIPVEVVPFARPVLVHRFGRDGYRVRLRLAPDGRPFRTDNGNELLDLDPLRPIEDAAATARALAAPTGVVETGIFVGLASAVLVGHADGSVEERRPTARSSA
jgi:ribose 5-phosphate isomerase A